jgi:hypothetical protein
MSNFGYPKDESPVPMTPIMAFLKDVERRAKLKTASEKRARIPGAPLPPTVQHLPIWPQATRGIPNCFARSALFSVSETAPRPKLENAEIVAQRGIKICHTGEKLDQGDLQLWLTLLHMLRTEPLDSDCPKNASQILHALGKTDSGGNRLVLTKRLHRLHTTNLLVEVDGRCYQGSLLDAASKDPSSNEWQIRLNSKLLTLLSDDQFTQIEYDVYSKLTGKPLAQWLFLYYSTHAKPFPLKVQTLLGLAGSENSSLTSSRQMLRKAMDAVVYASTQFGHTFSYEIRDDLVFVKKSGSAAQRRSLAKRKK